MSIDSRTILPNEAFLAISGITHNGHSFITDAINKGAKLVITTNKFQCSDEIKVPIWQLASLEKKVGIIADYFFDKPSTDLIVIGITGTNGKTSCAHLIQQIANKTGYPCSILGTLGAGQINNLEKINNTTPNAIEIHRWLAKFKKQGQKVVAMEVSSHALAQYRVHGVKFNCAIFTNLSADHLDYHKDMHSYGMTKNKLFTNLAPTISLINIVDAWGLKLYKLLKNTKKNSKVVSYAINNNQLIPDFFATKVQYSMEGSTGYIHTATGNIKFNSSLIGEFNVINLIAALSATMLIGIQHNKLQHALTNISPIVGRMACYKIHKKAPTIVIDFAHTPQALELVLKELKKFAINKLWCIFGCGGNRDKTKRPIMGSIAENYADIILLTNDNPRFEEPMAIIEDIKSGMLQSEKRKVILNRSSAIQYALANAHPKDIILIAGKGHETYQILGDKKISFSDYKVVADYFKNKVI